MKYIKHNIYSQIIGKVLPSHTKDYWLSPHRFASFEKKSLEGAIKHL